MTPTPTAAESTLTYSNCIVNPETIQIRNPDGTRPIRSATHSSGGEDIDFDVWFVLNQNQRRALEFASNVEGIAEVRQFIENTDLSSQTVAIIQYNFDSCKSIDVEFVKWQEEKIES